jgi:hypothetical protein
MPVVGAAEPADKEVLKAAAGALRAAWGLDGAAAAAILNAFSRAGVADEPLFRRLARHLRSLPPGLLDSAAVATAVCLIVSVSVSVCRCRCVCVCVSMRQWECGSDEGLPPCLHDFVSLATAGAASILTK